MRPSEALMTTLIVILVVVVGLALWAVGQYNRLVPLRNRSRTRSRRSTCSSSAATT